MSALLGDKFTCLICGQEDLSEGDMRSHVLLEHVECNVCCPFCDLSGITNEEMTTHINSVHFDDLMSPIEICNGEAETQEPVGREDADKFGLQHGGAIPKTNVGTKSGLKHSQSLDKGKISISPKKSSSMKMSQSESNLDRSKLQLTFPVVLNPHPSSSVRQSRSSTAIKSSTSSSSIRTSSTSSLIRPSTSFDVFQLETARSDDLNRSYEMNGSNSSAISASMSSSSGFHVSMNSSIQEEESMDDDNNNEPTQPNNNTPLVPDINDNIQMDVNSNIPAEFSCPLCQFITSSENLIQTHVNMVHVDILSPAKALSTVGLHQENSAAQDSTSDNTISEVTVNGMDSLEDEYPCPICQRIFSNTGELSLHVNTLHSNIFSPDKAGPNEASGSNEDWSLRDELLCPVCEQIFYDRNKLQVHVNGHFSAEQTPVQEKTDKIIAQELQEKEKIISAEIEKKEFQQLQAMYGMTDGTPYKKQYEKNLEKAVASGSLSVVDYHEKKTGFKQATARGVDDGISCTKGVIQRLQEYYKTPYHGVVRAHLCTTVDHYAASYGDKGWGCGYRNFQMLLSSLVTEEMYCKILFNGKTMIPSIPKIQQLIEAAWERGFDKQGCEQLGGKVYNSTKWIGATEIVATLASLKVRCQLLDFHNPSGPNGTHTRLFEWVREYFEKPATFKPPLYLQHQGHSRTIVGIEKLKDKSVRLLIFDPSTSKKQISLFHSIVNANLMRTLRRSIQGLKSKQYQIVAVTGILSDKQLEEHKVLRSERLS